MCCDFMIYIHCVSRPRVIEYTWESMREREGLGKREREESADEESHQGYQVSELDEVYVRASGKKKGKEDEEREREREKMEV